MNEQKKVPIIYLLGAGRSGTTLLGTVMNSHENIITVGEMHQFLEHLIDKKSCSCGKELNKCSFWSSILEKHNSNEDYIVLDEMTKRLESHKNIPKLLFSGFSNEEYFKIQNNIFKTIQTKNPKKTLLDSSKYIARYLMLRKSPVLNVKGIYVVRDIRGVINSFDKKVQTMKKPLSAIVYYMTINFFGQIVCWMDKKVIKIRYEDFVNNPEKSLERIYSHVFEVPIKIEAIPTDFIMPHIIGGNRMKKNKTIHISSDLKWTIAIPRLKQILYYLFSAPLMIINKYKI